MRQLPFAPVLEIVNRRWPDRFQNGDGVNSLPVKARQRYLRAHHDGWISERVADRLAVSLGYLPSEIWPNWYSRPEICWWCETACQATRECERARDALLDRRMSEIGARARTALTFLEAA